MANIAAAGNYLGLRASENSQVKQDKVDHREPPSGKEGMKVWNTNDLIFSDKKRSETSHGIRQGFEKVYAFLVSFRFKKDHQNGQQIRVTIDKAHSKVYPVRKLTIVILRKGKLGHTIDLPVGIYFNNKGGVKYLTSNKVTEIIKEAC